MPDLVFVPLPEFHRLEKLKLEALERTRLFATFCRINTLYMIARAGSGHIGSSFSSLDIVSWLYLNEMRDGDVYFSSKGHDVPGLYAVLLGLGALPFDLIHELRRLGGLPGHPDVGTPGVVTNTGPLGMGISKAKGMAKANRLRGTRADIFVLTGDGELQEGQFWESLVSAVNGRMGEITAIVDHNKVQSDTFVQAVSDLGDLESKLRAFGLEVARCDGHDLGRLASVLKRFRKIVDRPKVIIADTIKGAGVSFMQHTAMSVGERFYRFHSGAPDDESYALAASELIADANRQLATYGAEPLRTQSRPRPDRPALSGVQRMVVAYSRELVKQAEREPRIVALDADLELDCGLIAFRERFPERFIECGIAEQDMVSQAGGLALRGLLPVVHSFACFLSTRPNEQIYNNATERTRIVYVASLAGILPSGPGHSHQSVRDISALGAVPGLVMLEPSCETEVVMAVDYALRQANSSVYLRLVSVPCRIPYELPAGYRLAEGRGVVLTEGEDAVMFAYGPVLLPEAYSAAAILREEHGIGLAVVNLPWLNRVDDAWLAETVGNRRHVLTLDNHYVWGGQGQFLASRLAGLDLEPRPQVHSLGLTDIPVSGQNDEALRAHGLDSAGLVDAVVGSLAPR